MSGSPKVVVSGSFRNLDAIRESIREFRAAGAAVLSPADSPRRAEDNNFIFLENDPKNATPCHLEMSHLLAISRADALYVCNPRGYVGLSTALEIGWAMALGKPTYTMEPIADTTLYSVVPRVAAPSEVVHEIEANRHRPGAELPRRLDQLQHYVADAVRARGFQDETVKDIILLTVEEFGELARALRKRFDLRMRSDAKDSSVEEELADLLFYILDLANACGVDLLTAFNAKEQVNAKRTWDVPSRSRE